MRTCTQADSDAKTPSTSQDVSSNLTTAAVATFESPQSYRESHDSDFSNDSAAFEDLLTQLKSTNLRKSFKSKLAPESSFVISDRSSSVSEAESTCDPTFYHRIENTRLKKSTEELVASLRRQLRFDTSSDDTDDQEEQEVSLCSSETDTSERYLRHTPSHPQSIQKTQSLTVPKSVKTPQSRRPLKVVQSSDVQVVGTTSGKKSSLPFIYSLGTLDHKSSAHPENRQRHPSAERFLKNFKKNREELANRLLAYFNEVVFDKKLPEELEVRWNERLLKTAGQCVYMRRNIKHSDGSLTTTRQVRIELSGKVCTSAERVRDTLLHEACHAAVWVVHGVNDGHGRLWREFVRKANAAFPLLPPVTVRHTYAIDTRFTYRCTGCFATINRHSKSLDLEKKVCGRCHSRFELIVNSKRGGVHPQHVVSSKVDCGEDSTTRPRPAFADFVKEHYKHVRQQTPNHKETMAQLGSMFRGMKIGVNNDNVN